MKTSVREVKVGRTTIKVRNYTDVMYFKGGWYPCEVVHMRTVRRKKALDKRKHN